MCKYTTFISTGKIILPTHDGSALPLSCKALIWLTVSGTIQFIVENELTLIFAIMNE